MRKRYPVGFFTLALFFVFVVLGLWMVFQAVNAADFGPRQYVEVGVGMSVFVLGVTCLVVSLGCFLARTDREASKHLSWLGRWRPRW